MRDWEAHYRAGDTPWDHGSAAPPLLEMIERHGAELWGGGPVLVPGCGSGHDVRAIAQAGAPAIGLDIAGTAVTKARAIPFDGPASYEHGDFLDPNWRAGRSFRAIWEHTCFCAISPHHRGRRLAGTQRPVFQDPRLRHRRLRGRTIGRVVTKAEQGERRPNGGPSTPAPAPPR
jgi:methyl halide transferase